MTERTKRQKASTVIQAGILVLAFLSTVKLLIAGINIDEEYAVAMSYRIAAGDGMFYKMWEPHQTSGFISALLIRIHMLFFDDRDYLVIFLRLGGAMLETAMALFVYRTLKKRHAQFVAFGAAMLCFLVLPKWILTPEFTDILLWGSICTAMCFFRAEYAAHVAHESRYTQRWMVGAGIFTCMMILAYPTCLLAVPFYIWGIYAVFKSGRYIISYFATCAVIGIGYLIYFISRLSLSDFLWGIRQMTTDSTHNAPYRDRVLIWASEVREWLLPVAVMACAAGCLCVLLKRKTRADWARIFILLTLLHQFGCWVWGKSENLMEPMLFFYAAYLVGLLILMRKDAGFYFAYLPGGVVWLSVILLTNTGLKPSGAFLLPGILAVLLALQEQGTQGEQEKRMNANAGRVLLICFAGLFLFARGFYVYETDGQKADIFYVKQKALSGPSKNVYYRYSDGVVYNDAAELLARYTTEKDVLLCADCHSIWYLLSDAGIGHYTTISTIEYGDRLSIYWERFPDKYPNFVLGQRDSGYVLFLKTILPMEEYAAEGNMVLYSVDF